MKSHDGSIIPRARNSESGQAIVMVLVLMVLMIGAAAMAIDMGNLYWAYRQLQSNTQAAALAGGRGFKQNIEATGLAYQYTGRTSSDFNFHTNLTAAGQTVTATATVGCVSPATYPTYGLAPCVAIGPNNGNAVKVVESTKVPTYFAKLFGVSPIPISATAIATATGGASAPWNVAIVIDTTGSMSTNDGSCPNLSGGGTLSRIKCSLQGVQTMLKAMAPCPAGVACTAANAIDTASIFTFPNLSTASAPSEYCGGGSPSVQNYSFPPSNPTSAGYNPTTTTYQIMGYLNNYQQYPPPQSGTALATNSNLTKAIGVTGSGCSGMQNPGGANTYYAGVIYAATASLLAQSAANPGTQNALILLSDGDSTAQQSDMGAGATNSGVYPSWVDECGQAVTAAGVAASKGVRVYSVAYGTASSGCASDKSVSAPNSVIYNNPCKSMQAIASSSAYFYSDANSTSTGCNSGSNSVTNLSSIFTAIANSFGNPRLLPPNVAFQ